MTTWAATMDFGVVHALAYPECRTGEGPVIATLQAIVEDPYFGAVEIAPIKDPAVREQSRALLAAAELQVVYLPVLLAYQSVYPEQLNLNGLNRHQITQLIDFDEEYFNLVYNLIQAYCWLTLIP